MCDVAAAVSLGMNLLMDDGGSSQAAAGSAAAGQASLRGIKLQERQYEDEAPYRKARIASGVAALGRAETLAGKQSPLQLTVIDEAAVAGSPWEQEQAAGRAAADTHAAIDASGATRARTLASLGIKPGDPAYTAGARETDAANAATLAGATTRAREGERTRGIEQRRLVAGSSMPTYDPNVPVTNASSITSGAANLANSQAQVASTLASQESQQRTAIGNAAGTIMERVFKPTSTPDFNLGDDWFEQGGQVDGPSHAQGGVPIEVEGGEYVIKGDSVRKYGPRLLKEVNEGTAIIIPTGSPRRLKMVA